MIKTCERLNQQRILLLCETIIGKYLSTDKPSKGLSGKMKYATDIYKRCIPTTGSLDLTAKLDWKEFFKSYQESAK